MKFRKVHCMLFVLAIIIGATAVQAGMPMPMPDVNTPTLKGAQTLSPGTIIIGATSGYPSTAFDAYFGMTPVFDLGVTAGLTYGGRISGLQQGVGLDVHVPLRFTLFHAGIVAGGLKVAPYFMVGRGWPSVSVGGDVGFLIDIAVPKIFKVIVGPEIRTGFTKDNANSNAADRASYNGAVWLDMGLETILVDKWYLGSMFKVGGQWTVGDKDTGDGIFNFLVYFGYKLK
ncbi:MAG: hypothetical protein GY762_07655 [Proteobacteria bacterium]|nr:hypothetical protein [Pseudomonadota bacterium]